MLPGGMWQLCTARATAYPPSLDLLQLISELICSTQMLRNRPTTQFLTLLLDGCNLSLGGPVDLGCGEGRGEVATGACWVLSEALGRVWRGVHKDLCLKAGKLNVRELVDGGLGEMMQKGSRRTGSERESECDSEYSVLFVRTC